jgi:dihydrofolate reductase
MIGSYRIEGYVIASADGMIEDADGGMPASLQPEADKRYFEEALEHAEVVVHGRNSQEIQPNSPRRRRLILTHSVAGIAPDPSNPRARFWNPAGASFEDACAALGVTGGKIAVIGGPHVYSLFLKMGYDVFHLCRAVQVRLPGGLPVFVPEMFGGEPDAALSAMGLRAGETIMLDGEASVTDWTRE